MPGRLREAVAEFADRGRMLGCERSHGDRPPREHNQLVAEFSELNDFFHAKGPANSCGHGCNEWISAVGVFDAGTSQRFRDFIEKLNGRNLPIFFHSPGGSIKTAIEVGYLLRERRMSAGIGRTDTKCRVFDKRAGGQKLFKDGGPIARRYFLDLGVDPEFGGHRGENTTKEFTF